MKIHPCTTKQQNACKRHCVYTICQSIQGSTGYRNYCIYNEEKKKQRKRQEWGVRERKGRRGIRNALFTIMWIGVNRTKWLLF